MKHASDRVLFAALAFIAGMVDVISWLTLGGLFTAHVTGNLVVMAADLVDGRGMRPAQALAVPLFLIVAAGIAVGNRVFHPHSRTLIRILLWVQTGLLAASASVAALVMPSGEPHGLGAGLVAMLAVAAMASQNALLHLASKPIPTTAVMTGNLVVAAMSLASVVASRWSDAEAKSRWQSTWPILAGFVAGCALGAASVSAVGDRAWLAAAFAAFTCAMSFSAVSIADHHAE